MQSLKSKLIIFMIKNRHIFEGKLRPEVVDENFSVQAFRDSISNSSAKVEKIPEDTDVKSVDLDGMYGEWIIPKDAPDEHVLLYIHGGGFITGDCLSHRMHMTKFAKGSGVKVLQFNYRLAPEHPFPAAVDDCLKAYNWLLSNGYKSENIVIGGESAGGTLTLSLLMKLKQQKLPLPNRAFSISPVTDLSCSAASFEYNAKKDIAPMGSWNVWTKMYIADHDIKDPILSPQFGDPTGFPPLLICVGSHEIHLDDAAAFADKAGKSGVDVRFKVWDKMVHAFPMLAPILDEANEAMAWINDFVKNG